MRAYSASQRRAAVWTIVPSAALRSKVERLMTLSTSAVAACCARASSSSRLSTATLVVLALVPRRLRARGADLPGLLFFEARASRDADRRRRGAAADARVLRRLLMGARPVVD